MKDYNSPENVEARKNQEDPIVMYLIVRESLGMGMGKTAAQCAHASQMLQMKFDWAEMSNDASVLTAKHKTFQAWIDSSFRKVVLKADDKEWEKIKSEYKDSLVLVVDAGLTEIPSGSETVIGLWTMYKSEASKTIKKLQVLK